MSPKIFSSKKNIIIISIIAAILIIGGTIAAVTLSNGISVSVGITDMLQLADRYLTEMNYEQAIVEFQKILEIDPKNVDAYIGLADAYIAVGEKEKAMEALNQAKNNIENEQRIENKLAEVNSISETAQDTAEPSTESVNTTTTAAATTAATTTATTPPQTTTTRAETTTAEPVTQTTTTEATTAASQTTAPPAATTEATTPQTQATTTTPPPETTETSVTQSVSIVPQLAENVAWIAGKEYIVDLNDIKGKCFTPEQLNEFSPDYYGEVYSYPGELSMLCDKINQPKLCNLYGRANNIQNKIIVNNSGLVANWETMIQVNNCYYYQTQYTFKSFYSAFLHIYTEEAAKEIFYGEFGNGFMCLNGQLWIMERSVGGDATRILDEFELVSQTETEIVIRRITYHGEPFEKYDPLKKGQYKTNEKDYRFVLVGNNWRMDNFLFVL